MVPIGTGPSLRMSVPPWELFRKQPASYKDVLLQLLIIQSLALIFMTSFLGWYRIGFYGAVQPVLAAAEKGGCLAVCFCIQFFDTEDQRQGSAGLGPCREYGFQSCIHRGASEEPDLTDVCLRPSPVLAIRRPRRITASGTACPSESEMRRLSFAAAA